MPKGKRVEPETIEEARIQWENGKDVLAIARTLSVSAGSINQWKNKFGWDYDIRKASADRIRQDKKDRAKSNRKSKAQKAIDSILEAKPENQSESPTIVVEATEDVVRVEAEPITDIISPDNELAKPDDRTALVSQNNYKINQSDKLATVAKNVLESITDDDIQDASLRDKAYAMDSMFKNARLLANESTENVAVGVQVLPSILRMTKKKKLAHRFDGL